MHLKPVVQYSLGGVRLAEYPSLVSAARAVGGFAQHICSVARGHFRTYKGFQWHYASEELEAVEPVPTFSYYAYTPEGAFIMCYATAAGAADRVGISSSHISKAALQGGLAGGFQWRVFDVHGAESPPTSVSPYTTRLRGAVRQYDREGCFLAEYPSVVAAATALEIPQRTAMGIYSAASDYGGNKSACGYQWRFTTDEAPEALPPLSPRAGHRKQKVPGSTRARAVQQLTLGGRLLQVHPSMHQAAQATGIPQVKISQAVRKVRGYRDGQAGGFLWQSAGRGRNRVRAVQQLGPDGAVIRTYQSVAKAAKAVGRSRASIYTACERGTTAGGYPWRYADIAG